MSRKSRGQQMHGPIDGNTMPARPVRRPLTTGRAPGSDGLAVPPLARKTRTGIRRYPRLRVSGR